MFAPNFDVSIYTDNCEKDLAKNIVDLINSGKSHINHIKDGLIESAVKRDLFISTSGLGQTGNCGQIWKRPSFDMEKKL